jgi:hypothetical protein
MKFTFNFGYFSTSSAKLIPQTPSNFLSLRSILLLSFQINAEAFPSRFQVYVSLLAHTLYMFRPLYSHSFHHSNNIHLPDYYIQRDVEYNKHKADIDKNFPNNKSIITHTTFYLQQHRPLNKAFKAINENIRFYSTETKTTRILIQQNHTNQYRILCTLF